MKHRAMIVLGGCFAISFLGRIAVFASDVNQSVDDDSAPSNTPVAHAAGDHAAGDHENCLTGEFAAEIKARIGDLNGREEKIAKKEAELEIYTRQVDKRIAELETANTDLQNRIDILDARKSEDIQKLASIYNSMKPQLAGEILIEMDPDFAAGLLAQMDNERAGAIIAAMEPKKAYVVSLKLANRSQQ